MEGLRRYEIVKLLHCYIAKLFMTYPKKVLNFIDNREVASKSGKFFPKINPDHGRVIGRVARGNKKDANLAVEAAIGAFDKWSQTSVVDRSVLLREATILMQKRQGEIAEIVSLETGKSKKDALGEVGGAIELGFFMAGEGRRFYGRTTTSAVPNRTAMTIRAPLGICALIIPANTPIANVCWKAFPALLCGNCAVMKPSEDAPYTALWFAEILAEVGLPGGVFSVVHGFGEEVGAPLVEDSRVDLVSFTGSVPVGKYIQKTAGARLARVSLELGGKNPFVVCDDCDLEKAVSDAVLSAFSNAGQRCASGSRIIIFESVYEEFKNLMVEKTKKLKLGVSDDDDFGPVINERQLLNMLVAVKRATKLGAKLLTGGERLTDASHKKGFYMAPTILENSDPVSEISREELFGPITCFYKARDLEGAIFISNNSPFGLTAAIHTQSIHRAEVFKNKIQAGVVSINGSTYGSEPHMPFGGVKNSGTGWREPGTEALDVYSEMKTVYIKHFPELA